ncbi:MAG: triphosphoribosyl-dephospho-CoA synthase [Planctomycetaceae bacterium]
MERNIRLACLIEATAKKPGNVHPDAQFPDLTYSDFVTSANVIAPILTHENSRSLGDIILKAVRATQEQVGRNSNLGIILLLAPLAKTSRQLQTGNKASILADNLCSATNISDILSVWQAEIQKVLNQLTQSDAAKTYRAIRLANPGGMGTAGKHDLSEEPSETLLEVMRAAANRDRIAAEYARGFPVILKYAVPKLVKFWNSEGISDWENAVIQLHLHLMADFPDTLIARKCGQEIADESARRAREVLQAGGTTTEIGSEKLQQFDEWLRADGNRRNPGTTADLVAASLFVALEADLIAAPVDVINFTELSFSSGRIDDDEMPA